MNCVSLKTKKTIRVYCPLSAKIIHKCQPKTLWIDFSRTLLSLHESRLKLIKTVGWPGKNNTSNMKERQNTA